MSKLKVYSTAQYSRYLAGMVREDFPGFEIDLEDKIRFSEDKFRMRFKPGKIVIPGGNYGAISLTEKDEDIDKENIVGSAKVPTLFVCEAREIPRWMAIANKFNDEKDMRNYLEANNHGDVVSCYVVADIRRFTNDSG